jgi:hypothetical protein
VVSSSCHDCRLLCPRAIKAVKGTNEWNWPCKQLYICSRLWRSKDNWLRWLVAGIDLITNGTIQHLSCAALFILLNCVIAVCTLEWPKSWCKRRIWDWCKRRIWEILCCFVRLPCWEQDLSTVLGARFRDCSSDVCMYVCPRSKSCRIFSDLPDFAKSLMTSPFKRSWTFLSL